MTDDHPTCLAEMPGPTGVPVLCTAPAFGLLAGAPTCWYHLRLADARAQRPQDIRPLPSKPDRRRARP